MDGSDDDVRAIEALVTRQFASMNWRTGGGVDREAFAADFHADARLFPAARPARSQPPDAFLERMAAVVERGLVEFAQRPLGITVQVFGNVAVATGVCENVENGGAPQRGVEAFLLVKDGAAWRIAAQAWDMERDGVRVPASMLDGGGVRGD